jgi:hypothetical protein
MRREIDEDEEERVMIEQDGLDMICYSGYVMVARQVFPSGSEFASWPDASAQSETSNLNLKLANSCFQFLLAPFSYSICLGTRFFLVPSG